jgi:hypothetical protein
VFYTPYTVRVKWCSFLLSAMLTPGRSRGVRRAVGLDPVLHHGALVLPLLVFTRPRGRLLQFWQLVVFRFKTQDGGFPRPAGMRCTLC